METSSRSIELNDMVFAGKKADTSIPMKSVLVEKYRITLDDAYNDIAPDIRAMLSKSDLRHFVNGWNTFVNTKLQQAIQAARIEAKEEERENCNCKRDENNKRGD